MTDQLFSLATTLVWATALVLVSRYVSLALVAVADAYGRMTPDDDEQPPAKPVGRPIPVAKRGGEYDQGSVVKTWREVKN